MDAPEPAAWNAVLLVCRECRKRGNGPRDTKPKSLARDLKLSTRTLRPRPRVLLTSCLGLCPKRATAVARIDGSSGGAVIAAVDSKTSLESVAGG